MLLRKPHNSPQVVRKPKNPNRKNAARCGCHTKPRTLSSGATTITRGRPVCACTRAARSPRTRASRRPGRSQGRTTNSTLHSSIISTASAYVARLECGPAHPGYAHPWRAAELARGQLHQGVDECEEHVKQEMAVMRDDLEPARRAGAQGRPSRGIVARRGEAGHQRLLGQAAADGWLQRLGGHPGRTHRDSNNLAGVPRSDQGVAARARARDGGAPSHPPRPPPPGRKGWAMSGSPRLS